MRLVNRPAGTKPTFTVIDGKLGEKIPLAVRGEDPWDVAAHLALGLDLRRENVSTGWRRFARGNGFEGAMFHTLRHGAATLMLVGGVSDAVAIEIMGHADTRILRRYQAVVDDLKQDAATRMDSVLGG